MTQDSVNVAQLPEFDEIIDVRSPSEFALDHIPGAINCPVLDDAERALVGTIYVQESAFTAKKKGAALVARNISKHIENCFADKPRNWRPLVYCWRGGQRSASMAIVLRQVGWDARKLAGGYKAYRRHAVTEIDRLIPAITFIVICGLTGAGKSALLRALAEQNAQVLDLEKLAAHRGSVLGNLPEESQPGQKMFESRIWNALDSYSASEVVYVEAESRRIGNLRVPDSLINKMRASPCIQLDTALKARVALLLREYGHFTQDTATLFARLDCLVTLHGHARIDHWKSLASEQNWETFVREMLEDHYDPAYRKSSYANYPGLITAMRYQIELGSPPEFAALARELIVAQNASIIDATARAGALQS